MKNLIVPLLAVALFFGCSSSNNIKEQGQQIENFEIKVPAAPQDLVKTEGPDEFPVFFTERVHKNLSIVYANTETEIPFCLFGEKGKGGLVVDRVEFPSIDSSTDSTASFEGRRCSIQKDFVGYVHNHDPPGSLCEPTPLDKVRFALNSDSKVELIACTWETEVTYHAFGL
jgi:hypothetical protein